jgi:hypothetical protein
VRFSRFILHPRLIRNPVHFPSLAAIIGVGLFKVGQIRGGVRPNKSNKDSFAIPFVLAVKLTASILELANLRWVDGAVLAIGRRRAKEVNTEKEPRKPGILNAVLQSRSRH